MQLRETFAAGGVLASLVAVPLIISGYHQGYVLGRYGTDARVVTLTGVGRDGVWTEETVNCGNYWRKKFQRATLHLEEGEHVVLRLQSFDVTHRFYCPELGIGPIDVEPGHTEIVEFDARSAGTYRYYCTSMCGDCHFYMQGWIVITPAGESPEEPEEGMCPHEVEPPLKDDMIQRGRYLYQKMSCIACHGKEGQGDIPNFNYAKQTMPAHNKLAETMFLEEPEEAEALIKLVVEGADLSKIRRHPDIPMFRRVYIKYKDAKELILKGKDDTGKKDPAGPEPPLQMPSWSAWLTERDADAILVYLISLYSWEEDENE